MEIVGSNAGLTEGSTNVTFAIPAARESGDLFLAMAGARSGIPDTPTGYTRVADSGTYTARPVATFNRTSDGTETEISIDAPGADRLGGVLVVLREATFSGMDTAVDVDTQPTMTGPAVTAGGRGRMFVAISHRGSAEPILPSGWTDHGSPGTGSSDAGHGVALHSGPVLAAGTVGPIDFIRANTYASVSLWIASIVPVGWRLWVAES